MPVTATTFGPFDAGAGANIAEDTWRKFARLWLPTGVTRIFAPTALNDLNPFGDSSGMQVKVDTGAVWIQGHYGEWTTGISILAIAAVGGIPGGQERWDSIIARADFVNNIVELDILTGTPGAPPAARPAVTQSTAKWEIKLADVGPLVNTTTTITAGMVVGTRPISVIIDPSNQNPTFGALQTGIASQVMGGSASDTRGFFILTTTATPPAANALLALINYFKVKIIGTTMIQGQSPLYFYTDSQTTTQFNVKCSSALAASTAYTVQYITLGA